MLHGFRRDECDVLSASYLNVSFIPGTCGYLCPTRTTVAVKPRFYEYKVSKKNSHCFRRWCSGFYKDNLLSLLQSLPILREYQDKDY